MDHDRHSHNFINKHTAFAILLLIIGCFCAGYFIGRHAGEYRPRDAQLRDAYMLEGNY